jgi:hypothetical protein
MSVLLSYETYPRQRVFHTHDGIEVGGENVIGQIKK